MSIDYREWPPSAALEGVVLAYWSVTGDGTAVPSPAILPDAYVEIVLNVGDPVTLAGRAFTGPQPTRTVVGILDEAIAMHYGANVGTIGIRLHAARAAAFLGVPARALVNRVSPLGQVSKKLDARLASAEGPSAIDAVLAGQLAEANAPDMLVVRAVDRLLGAEALVPVDDLARELGISPRQLHRRFLAGVGMAPKQLERRARFARAWQQATMGPPLTWAELALANGYADQAHLVREFRAFGAEPPAHLFTAEWYDATSVKRT